jgi:3-oxoacyl-[acyl-carrier-protein] synthase-3
MHEVRLHPANGAAGPGGTQQSASDARMDALDRNTPNTAPRVWTDPTPVRVLGMGTALPGLPVETDALLEMVDAPFGLYLRGRGDAVARKLGIRTRHICRSFDHPVEGPRLGQRNPDLAAQAVRGALAEAGLAPGNLAYLIGHTATPATALPANVAQVAAGLDYHGPFAEFRQACTGFANALVFALCLLRAGSGPVAIVGSETGSVHFDPRRAASDPGQLVNMLQMGDAAAAVVLARDDGRPGARLSRVFHGQMGPNHAPGLSVPHGGSDAPGVPGGLHEFAHDYAAVRTSGPALLRRCAEAAADAGIHAADWTLPHQANGNMDELLEGLLGIPRARVVCSGRHVGNTGSAAIWLALAQHRPALRPGGTVLALGAEATAHMFGGFCYEHG